MHTNRNNYGSNSVTSARREPDDEDFDITKTAGYKEAMDDVKNGRVTSYASVDEMFRAILG